MNPTHEYLFQAVGNRVSDTVKPVSRQYVHAKLKEAQEACELEYEIGTHSLRKTFGYHAYKAGTDIHTLQRLFKHSSSAVTLAYIGITAETVADVYDLVSLG
jgi:site-specific recombinase XerD